MSAETEAKLRAAALAYSDATEKWEGASRDEQEEFEPAMRQSRLDLLVTARFFARAALAAPAPLAEAEKAVLDAALEMHAADEVYHPFAFAPEGFDQQKAEAAFAELELRAAAFHEAVGKLAALRAAAPGAETGTVAG